MTKKPKKDYSKVEYVGQRLQGGLEEVFNQSYGMVIDVNFSYRDNAARFSYECMGISSHITITKVGHKGNLYDVVEEFSYPGVGKERNENVDVFLKLECQIKPDRNNNFRIPDGYKKDFAKKRVDNFKKAYGKRKQIPIKKKEESEEVSDSE